MKIGQEVAAGKKEWFKNLVTLQMSVNVPRELCLHCNKLKATSRRMFISHTRQISKKTQNW
jgi:hypothetical protein